MVSNRTLDSSAFISGAGLIHEVVAAGPAAVDECFVMKPKLIVLLPARALLSGMVGSSVLLHLFFSPYFCKSLLIDVSLVSVAYALTVIEQRIPYAGR